MEVDFQNRTSGHSLKYGEVEPWKQIAELYGTTKPSRGKRFKQGAGIDDRRPPDTTKALLSNKNNHRDNKIKFELQQKYQSYSHNRNSCYITALLEMLYICYLNNATWWSSNIGTMQNSDSGLKKLHISFTLRDAAGTKGIKTILNRAREMIREHVIDKKWQKDNQFGSLTDWFEKIIAEEKSSITLISEFCVLGLRKWICNSGHIRISPIPIKPFYPINGMEEFNDSFFQENQNLKGQVSALFIKKNELIHCVHPDEPCPYDRSNLSQCVDRKINYEEYIISYPPILIFELTQRDGANYNSSEQLDFPLHLSCKSNEESLEYTLTARAFSTLSSGHHFYCKVIRSFNEQRAVYRYDDLRDGGMAYLESNDVTSIAGCQALTVLVAYTLNNPSTATNYSNRRASKY